MLKLLNRVCEVDPRSKTTADQAFNYIATGDNLNYQLEVTKRMLAEKKKEFYLRTKLCGYRQ